MKVFLQLSLLGVLSVTTCLYADEIALVETRPFLQPPQDGVRVNAWSYYSDVQRPTLISMHNFQTRSDTFDVAFRRISTDNGQTWDPLGRITTSERTDRGMRRTYPRIGFVDPHTNRLIELWLDGTLPSDDPLEGMRHWTLRYRLSRDAGRSFYHDGPVVHVGAEFSAAHPLPGVHVGKSSFMIGDKSCMPIALENGDILQPVQITPTGPDGVYHNPGGGYTYHDSAVLIGRWNQAEHIEWTVSERIVGDPKRTTRGVLEPTIAQFADGRILMVMRGSNHRRPELPGHKWFSVSTDAGRTWSLPEPWTYDDDRPFHSPSSCSQLLRHSSGRVYWIGNISPENPRGNLPRYPLVVGTVDPTTLRLRRESLYTIDTRRPDDSQQLQISNFLAREDRETGHLVVHASPFNRRPDGTLDADGRDVNWTAPALVYVLRVTAES